MTTQVIFLTQASDTIYGGSALQYVRDNQINIERVVTRVGVSAGAIAGAMAEENNAYGAVDVAADFFVSSSSSKRGQRH